jgi:hypothetical protein
LLSCGLLLASTSGYNSFARSHSLFGSRPLHEIVKRHLTVGNVNVFDFEGIADTIDTIGVPQGCSTLSSWTGESEMQHADANRRRVAA